MPQDQAYGRKYRSFQDGASHEWGTSPYQPEYDYTEHYLAFHDEINDIVRDLEINASGEFSYRAVPGLVYFYFSQEGDLMYFILRWNNVQPG